MTRGGRVFIASEGIQNEEPRVPPAIVEYTRNYAFVRQLDVPAKFVPPATGPITRGVRNNASFESLTLTPDEQRLFTADRVAAGPGRPACHGRCGRAGTGPRVRGRRRVLRAAPRIRLPDRSTGTYRLHARLHVSGLVELLALSDTEFLAMERGFAQERDGPRA
jgi:hypothetical protein